MLSDSYWQKRGFEPVPFGKGLRVFLMLSTGIAVLVAVCGLVGTIAPFGLALVALAEHERRREATWFGFLSFERKDHPVLFWFIVGPLYAHGAWFVALDLHRLFSAPL